MSYESAPATKLLATRCAACARPLVDAKSVETGMGPDCRKKHGYEVEGVSEEARNAANKIVYTVAATYGRENADTVNLIDQLRGLGFHQLAEVLMDRVTQIRIFEEGTDLIVHTPYADGVATPDWRAIPGRRWLKEEKANLVPASQRKAVYALLLRHFKGALGDGPKGGFQVGEKATARINAEEDKREAYKAGLERAEDVEAEMHRMEAEGDREQTRKDDERKAAIDKLVEQGCPLAEAERVVANVEAGRCPDGCCGGPEEHGAIEEDDEAFLDAAIEARNELGFIANGYNDMGEV